MTVETPERDWTDSRLNYFRKAVDDGHKEMKAGFARVDERFEKLDKKMDAGYERLDKKMDAGFSELRGEMKAGYDKLEKKIDTDIRELRGDIKWLVWGLVPIGTSTIGTFIHGFFS